MMVVRRGTYKGSTVNQHDVLVQMQSDAILYVIFLWLPTQLKRYAVNDDDDDDDDDGDDDVDDDDNDDNDSDVIHQHQSSKRQTWRSVQWDPRCRTRKPANHYYFDDHDYHHDNFDDDHDDDKMMVISPACLRRVNI